ncbi:hypothetical protein DENIS_0678 [Desulfonema ishimotonii]|uniref:NACHT domain-containing protein n=1 Tax=Desulfonema ishimotonii TaxID=45657 RepID=A0A401FRZ2_9BACT|nr:pentapeptide repeat-containing protein [Desulfonema ishimotonii]GBC59737.1 hypothetical protein DENIS_0678 [Desulfonema ishimotonii]
MTSTWKDSEWRTSFLANLLSMNPGGVAVDLAKLLKGIKDEDERQAVEHTKGILESLNDDPLPIDPDLKLWEIYVPPSVRYWSPDNEDKHDKDKAGELPDLFASLLGAIEDSDAPVVIHGQPGHGKTSSVKMLTHFINAKEQEEKKKKRTHVLMYEFKFLGRLDDNEIQVLSRRTSFLKNESFFHGKNTVLILDGLDERQITDGSDYALKDFVRLMFRLSENVNKRDDSKLNLILTGRSQFVRQVQNAFTGPYHQYEIRDFVEEQVGTWLRKYCVIKKIEPELKYENFESKKLKDLIHQPILLTISAMMLADETGRRLIEDVGDREITRGDIYQIIIQWTYERKWQCHPNCAHLPNAASYRKFLRILAFILFRHGEETIKISTLIEALKKHEALYDLEWIKTKSDETIEDICKNVAVSFFFKGLEENAFSFIHKTVRDYLTVEAIFDLLKEATENFNPRRPGKSCDNTAEDIYFILGKSKLSHEDHLPFLEDIITARNADARELFDPLETFFKTALDHIHLIKHENGQNVNPLITEANVLSGLLYWITEIFQTFSEEERKERYEGGYLKIFEPPDGFHKFISFLNASELFGYSLYSFKLKFANLRDAGLGGANLRGVKLREANLEAADLRGANLGAADLRGASLEAADLRGANLSLTNLRGANLRGANLRGAALYGANLRGTNFLRAIFLDTNLTDTDLSLASNLTFQKIQQAITNETTILPDYLKQEDEPEDAE